MPAGIWNRVARQPQSLWLRKAIFQVHLWTGIAVGLYVLMISLSGSVLVYRNELYRAFSPKPVIVDGSGQPISHEAAETAARRAYPGWDVSEVRMGETVSHAIEVSLASGDRTRRRLLHPFTGEDLGDPLPAGYRLTAWLLDLHDNLLGGETGRRVNGIGAVSLILLCATGAVIWWPGVGRLRRSLLVSPRAHWKRVIWSLHSALGFWFFGFILIWGVSGAYLSFPQAFGTLFDVLEPLDETNPVERVVDRIQYWLAYLHFGRLGGRGIPGCGRGLCNSTTMLVWAIAGMVPAAMFVTGALMWWSRVLRRRCATAPAEHADAEPLAPRPARAEWS